VKIIIKHDTYEMPVYSIYSSPDPQDPDNRKVRMFFCWNCQAPVTQYIGVITSMNIGEPIVRLGQISKCKNSKCSI